VQWGWVRGTLILYCTSVLIQMFFKKFDAMAVAADVEAAA